MKERTSFGGTRYQLKTLGMETNGCCQVQSAKIMCVLNRN